MLLRALTTAWLSRSPSTKKGYGSSSIQGRRPNQEDRFCACEQLPGMSGCGFYAVYDGHGGHRAASFAAERMQGYLTRSKGFKGKDLLSALQQAFHECETEFIQIAGREGLRDGTTAVVALVQDDCLHVAHVGDSRCVLGRAGGRTQGVTQDHKPELALEKQRIEALGGFVSYIGCWRAMGILAMSRALGDLFLKPYVSAEPDVCRYELNETDEFIILASDGVFDVFDNETVVRIARSAPSPQEAANLLTNSAFHAGSLDNVTAVVVALRGYRPNSGVAPASVAEPQCTQGGVRDAIRRCAPLILGDAAASSDAHASASGDDVRCALTPSPTQRSSSARWMAPSSSLLCTGDRREASVSACAQTADAAMPTPAVASAATVSECARLPRPVGVPPIATDASASSACERVSGGPSSMAATPRVGYSRLWRPKSRFDGLGWIDLLGVAA